LEYDEYDTHPWEISELTTDERLSFEKAACGIQERCPMIMSLNIRSDISDHEDFLKKKSLSVNKELKLMALVDNIVHAFNRIFALRNYQYPFPLAQMGRTFVFVWTFTLPFAIVQDISNIYAACCALFLITYGFIGIELVSIELDDPFGDDPNDLDVMAMAQAVCGDLYSILQDVDGQDAVRKLKYCLGTGKPVATPPRNKNMPFINPAAIANPQGIVYSSYLGASIMSSEDTTKSSNTFEYFSESDSLLEGRTDRPIFDHR